ncbi:MULTISPECIES: GIY-YIG nuclease family protein [unclassified Phaeobacter]|uniref:GIY-YIG nuclease family protein n=1 Tax=unclassified Phaeobacter TaxID=2621772 RepID=UPI003A8801F5
MAKAFTQEDDDILAELGVEVETKKVASHTPREERIIAGFEEIQRFTDEHGRVPQHGESGDIFERLYAVRLDRIREQPECRELVEPLDRQGLLTGTASVVAIDTEELDDDALLAELGVDVETPPIAELKHVRSTAEKKAAEDVANRERCEDFETFKPLFDQVQKEIASGLRETRPFERKADIEKGRFFIVGGQTAYVAERGEDFLTDQGMTDARLRVIFANGTQSKMLMRSLQRALNKDEAGRRVTEPNAGPLFSDQTIDGDESSGTIYVLRSKSNLPIVKENRNVLHKIGVTSGKVERRIANAKIDATFLLADVEVVATYELYNINRTKLENLIHRIFEPARLDIEIKDRFGNPVVPREWFLAPLFAIKDAVEKIKDGTIADFKYDPNTASLSRREG